MEQEYKDLLKGIATHLILLQEITTMNGRRQAYAKNDQMEEALKLKEEQGKLIEKLPDLKKLLEKCK